MEEVWKDIEGYDGRYQVSNYGNVRSLNWRNLGFTKNLKLRDQKYGYKQVLLSALGKSKMVTVHRLVALAFIPNPLLLPQINHKDLDKTNNHVENLEWCTASENMKHLYMNTCAGHKVHKKRPKYGDRCLRKISQFSVDGCFLKNWEDCLEIKRAFGYSQTSVWECCDEKRKTAYGYIWRYAN